MILATPIVTYSYRTKVWTDFALNRENQSKHFSTHDPYNTHHGSTHAPCTFRFEQNKELGVISVVAGFNPNLGCNWSRSSRDCTEDIFNAHNRQINPFTQSATPRRDHTFSLWPP